MVFLIDVENFGVLVSIGWGEEDISMKIEQKGKVEVIYEKVKVVGEKVLEVEYKVYRFGCYGFVVWGNLDDLVERVCLEDFEKQVLVWFDCWF